MCIINETIVCKEIRILTFKTFRKQIRKKLGMRLKKLYLCTRNQEDASTSIKRESVTRSSWPSKSNTIKNTQEYGEDSV